MKPYWRNLVHLVALIRRYCLFQLTRWVRQWEKRSLTQRKRDVLLLFGSLLLIKLANLSQHLPPRASDPKNRSPLGPSDSAAHHQLYLNELQNRNQTPSR